MHYLPAQPVIDRPDLLQTTHNMAGASAFFILHSNKRKARILSVVDYYVSCAGAPIREECIYEAGCDVLTA